MDFATVANEQRQKIDEALLHYFEKKHKELVVKDQVAEENFIAMQNYVQGKGKRLRSICLMAAYKASGGKQEEKILLPALSVEFLHNASLVLDDMMDEDKERRGIICAHTLLGDWFEKKVGKPPYKGNLFANAKNRFSVSMSIIAANMLFSLGEQTIIESELVERRKVSAIEAYEKTYRQLNLGQMLDIYYEYNPAVSEQNYLNMAYLKTGALLGGALKIGALLGGASALQLSAFEEYAKFAATTFQIQDDILDVTPGAEKGRELGSDLRKGKNTILVIEAKKELNAKDWEKVEKVLGNEKASEKEIQSIMKLFHEKKIVENCIQLAEQNIQRGKEALRKAKPLFSQRDLEFFDAFADYLLHRKK